MAFSALQNRCGFSTTFGNSFLYSKNSKAGGWNGGGGQLLKVSPPLGKTGDVFRGGAGRNPWLWSCNSHYPQKNSGFAILQSAPVRPEATNRGSRAPSRPGRWQSASGCPVSASEWRGDAVASSLARSPEGRIRVGASQPREAPPRPASFTRPGAFFFFYGEGKK